GIRDFHVTGVQTCAPPIYMANSLIEHKRINTTVAKAKALKQFVEPLVTKSKEDTTHNRRLVFAKLRQKDSVAELFRTVAPKVGEDRKSTRLNSSHVNISYA